jgi:hypothetical protein
MANAPVHLAARPIVHGFFVCREVFKDQRTGEHILLGPSIHFSIREFPWRLPVMGFLQMVDAHGNYQFTASLLDPEEEQVWHWSAERVVHHPEPLFPNQLIFHDWVLKVPRPGRYRLELFANGEELLTQGLFMGPAEFFLKGQ